MRELRADVTATVVEDLFVIRLLVQIRSAQLESRRIISRPVAKPRVRASTAR
ncbi:MAG: hypothetical protein GY871_15970 [Actinomycetales bacterium]|nr:hypothetical protein [Actinomycetales bacterium]